MRGERIRHEVDRAAHRATGAGQISRVIAKGDDAHRVDDVLPLGSISDVHGIVSNEHHMYELEAELFLAAFAADVRKDDLWVNLCRRRFCPTASATCRSPPHIQEFKYNNHPL